jgi:meso-butanediol dehydrogenase/(S,S)-butanediol dehydrogenase/diacetyl reductase
MGKLDNKIALVTGGGRGIGEAICRRLAEEGADVVVADINQDIAAETAKKVEAAGRRSLAVKVDVTKSKDVDEMVSATMDKFGRIDILVNNAGVLTVKPVVELDEEEWDKVIDVNLKGVFLVSKAVAKIMMNQRDGKIICIASAAAKRGLDLFAHYSASKGGVARFSQGLAHELAPYNINVNAVCPGIVPTDMWDKLDEEVGKYKGLPKGEITKMFSQVVPLGRMQPPEAIAAMVAFLASPDAQEVTAQAINVDGGLRDY